MGQVGHVFQAISEAALNAKLKTLENIHLGRGKSIIEYSNWNLELVSDVESAGHASSEIELKHPLLP